MFTNKNIIKVLFTHAKKERTGILVLLSIIIILFILPSLLPCGTKTTSENEWEEFVAKIDSFENKSNILHDNTPAYFTFDPNICDSTEFLQLGFTAAQTAVILRYRNKGGKFKTADDFARIYVVSDSVFRQLLPYIKINNASGKNAEKKNKIELNSADTVILKSLEGIGSYYARKIVERRSSLGGYALPEQLLEIQGINEDNLSKIKLYITIDTGLIQKININTVKASVLRKHPYLTPKMVQEITNQRVNRGDIPSLNVLINEGILTTEQADKLKPYLTF